jgi:HPt (histidine-containing phosphotransfer) domain-containing protein
MAALWERFRGTTAERVDALEAGIRALRADRSAPRAEAVSAAHKLAGSLGTFGFPEASRLARECESLLGSPAPLTPPELDLLTAHAASIRAELDRPPTV